jgi:ADP-heptose:LPS heptosyltransferase
MRAPASSEHVLYVRVDNAGDMLLQGPAIRAVAAQAQRVTVLCGPAGRSAAELLPGVDDVTCHRIPWIDADPLPTGRDAINGLIDDLAMRDVDRAIISTSWHQSPLPMALVLRLAGVPWVAAISDDYPGSLLDLRHRVSDSIHEVERALSLVAACGFVPAPGQSDRLALRTDDFADLPFKPGSYVVVHPGASSPARAWAPQKSTELVRMLREDRWSVAVTGAADEQELTETVAGVRRDGVADLGGETSLAELASVIGGAAAIVTGNTGPMHVAAATGTPVVCLYAPTVPAARWRPWRVPHELLATRRSCPECSSSECRVPGHPCIDDVPPSAVRAAVARLARAQRPVEAVQ